MRYNYFKSVTFAAMFMMAGPLLAADATPPAMPAAEQPVAASTAADQQRVDQLRSDYAKLKTEMNETLVQLRQLKAELAASTNDAQTDAASKQPVQAPDAASIDRKIDQIIASQNKLEQKLAAIEAKQAETDRAVQRAAATPVPDNGNSPYAYRYNANSQTPDTTAPQPTPGTTAATYTTYSNGYTSGYYVPPVQPVQSTGPVVYVNPQPTVVYTSPTYYYSGYYPYGYYPYYPYYYRTHYYYPSRLSVGVSDDHFFFGFNTGVRFGGHGYHHDHHH